MSNTGKASIQNILKTRPSSSYIEILRLRSSKKVPIILLIVRKHNEGKNVKRARHSYLAIIPHGAARLNYVFFFPHTGHFIIIVEILSEKEYFTYLSFLYPD